MTDQETTIRDFLLDIVPPDSTGQKTLSELARLLGISRWALQKWVRAKRIPPDRVGRLMEISRMDGRPSKQLREFDPFVYDLGSLA